MRDLSTSARKVTTSTREWNAVARELRVAAREQVACDTVAITHDTVTIVCVTREQLDVARVCNCCHTVAVLRVLSYGTRATTSCSRATTNLLPCDNIPLPCGDSRAATHRVFFTAPVRRTRAIKTVRLHPCDNKNVVARVPCGTFPPCDEVDRPKGRARRTK